MVWLLVPGALLGGAAIVAFIVFFASNGSMVALGATVVLAGVGWVPLYLGWHAINHKFAHKHATILRDLRAQGFKLDSNQVHDGGHYLQYTTEVDLQAGRCIVPLIARKDRSGIWHAALPSSQQNGDSVVFLTPNQVVNAC